MTPSTRVALTLAVLLLRSAGLNAVAEPRFDHGPVLTLNEENDLFVRTDRHYTQGLKLAYFHEDDFLPWGLSNLHSRLPTCGYRSHAAKLGYALGQNIYTPADIDTPELLKDDRPYAGWLYGGMLLHRRGLSAAGRPVLEALELELGMVGPASLAKEAQTWVHQVRALNIPQGWHHQLQNEPAFRFKYGRAGRFRTPERDPLQAEFIPQAGLNLGTVETSLRAGGTLRLGWRLPDDFGSQTIDSLLTSSGGHPKGVRVSWGAYGFAGVEGRVVLHNIFLDGNVFRESHRVDKKYAVGDFKAGFMLILGRVELGYTHVFRTPEFEHQTESDAFGALIAKVSF